MTTLSVFTADEYSKACDLLSAKVATMLGRKMEEDDWGFVYRNAKLIPMSNWSNLNIDFNHDGVGVEHKMLRVLSDKPIKAECGTCKMHPAGTRSIRLTPTGDANDAMESVFSQYSSLIEDRTQRVREKSGKAQVDMRTGWFLWKSGLDEFLYFEEPMIAPKPEDFYAQWNSSAARGARKSSTSLWIFEKSSGKKKYSVTTDAGVKIQPYFDVPPPTDPNLVYFKVQGFKENGGLVRVWLTRSTAKYLERILGSLSVDAMSDAIMKVERLEAASQSDFVTAEDIALPLRVSAKAYQRLSEIYEPISDEYMFQQLTIDLGKLL